MRNATLLAWDAARWVSQGMLMRVQFPCVSSMTPEQEANFREADSHLADCERAVGHEFARTTPPSFPLAMAVDHAEWCATFKRAA